MTEFLTFGTSNCIGVSTSPIHFSVDLPIRTSLGYSLLILPMSQRRPDWVWNHELTSVFSDKLFFLSLILADSLSLSSRCSHVPHLSEASDAMQLTKSLNAKLNASRLVKYVVAGVLVFDLFADTISAAQSSSSSCCGMPHADTITLSTCPSRSQQPYYFPP